ncbi:hypothetical protein FZ103_08730 [Streptomonospora sp. PA3]|uniref:hypothetical protein n=1 Tax=Streptomonospora sp. PA3 TaxID=2607326 RepID=UPI0012DC9947|nr:hypothetical protein [Streptomonospora sp. PA3]MUL41262.1 hypothetical protein [Streptomonospora sp. PA3]
MHPHSGRHPQPAPGSPYRHPGQAAPSEGASPPSTKRPERRGSGSAGKVLAWLGIGCAGVFAVGVIGGGVGGAYYLGWFETADTYTRPLDTCAFTDTGTMAEIAQEEDFFTDESTLGRGNERVECSSNNRADSPGNHAQVVSEVFLTVQSGLAKDNGTERAQRHAASFVEQNGLSASRCPGGGQIHTGYEGRIGTATHLVGNLFVTAQVEPSRVESGGLPESELAAAAEELLCGSLEGLPESS